MPDFHYQLKMTDGSSATGVVSADSSAAAAQQLRSTGGRIMDLTEVADSSRRGILSFSLKLRKGVSTKEILDFTSQISVMSKAGIGISQALSNISEQSQNPRMAEIIQSLNTDIESGKQFSQCLERFPKAFSTLYVNMVRASELSGSFAHMLDRIVAYISRQMETRSMVRSAMIYPLIILIMAIVTTVFMLTFVLPKFQVLFAGKEDILPLPTKILLGISASMTGYWWAYLAVVLVGFVAAAYTLHTEQGRVWFDTLKLKVPILKKLFRSLYISRGLRTMGELIAAGVPVLETITITADVTGNIHYFRLWGRVHAAVRKGQRIAPTLARSPLMPPSVAQMISAGEESGNLGDILMDVSDYYETQLKNVINNVTAAIEPIMVVLMGGVVGFIAASILLPIFKLSKVVG